MLFLAAAADHATASASRSRLMQILIGLGGFGVLGAAFLDSSIIPMPIPGTTDLLMLILIAHRGNPWLLALLAVLGSVAGGLLTWSTGKKGGEVSLERYVPRRLLKRITRWVSRHGGIAVCLATLLPPPTPLMPILLAAGALGIRRGRFLVSFTVGRVLRYSLVAWLGVRYGRAMIRWWNHYLASYAGVISWTIFGLFLAGIAWGVWKWHAGGKQQARRQTAATASGERSKPAEAAS